MGDRAVLGCLLCSRTCRSSVVSNREICCNCLERRRPFEESSWTNRTDSSGSIPSPPTKRHQNVPGISQSLHGHSCCTVHIVRCVVQWHPFPSIQRIGPSTIAFTHSIVIHRGPRISTGCRTAGCVKNAFQRCTLPRRLRGASSYSCLFLQSHVSCQSYGGCRRARVEIGFQRSQLQFI